MKKVTLKKLTLTNYRNIEFAEYEFNGNSKIVGDNRIGKTNVLESICWLLTDKLLNGSSDIQQIKPLNDTKKVVMVAGVFDIDGKEISIEKHYAEDWVKERNTKEVVLKGHYTDWIYNGVKQTNQKAFYNLFVEDFGIKFDQSIPVDLVQVQTNPSYLGEMGDGDDWKNLRSLIIKLVGDVTDEDVFNKKPETLAIKDDLVSFNNRIDQVKKRFTDDIKGLKETIAIEDARIQNFEQVGCPTEQEVAIAKKGIEDIDDKIVSLRSTSGNIALKNDIKNKIADKKIAIANIKNNEVVDDPAKKFKDKVSALYEDNRKYVDKGIELAEKARDLDFKIKSKELELNNAKNKRAKLIEEYKELKSATANVETVCPTCHRPLEASQIEEAKAKFEDSRNLKIQTNIELGKKVKVEIETLTEEIAKLTASRVDLEQPIKENKEILDANDKAIKEAQEEVAKIESNATVKPENPEIAKIEAEISKLEAELKQVEENDQVALNKANEEIVSLEAQKDPFKKTLADLDYFQRQLKEKEIVVESKEKHSKQLIDLEQKRDLVNVFIVTKLSLLDENVSKVFGGIKFQLIRENINGGFDTVCKPFIYDPITKKSTNVLWRSGSKSERVATGIAIAECIKASLGLSNLPFLFDEGGEISSDTMAHRLATDSQLICVKVQDSVTSPLVMPL